MFAVKAKNYGVSIINPALSLLMKHLVIGQRQKAPNFLAFHWSPHGSLVSIGQHFVTTRVVHFQERTETNLITESDLITSCWSYARPALPHNVASDQGLHCLLTGFSIKNRIKATK